ncbi:hypothetical protein O181_125985 [Austropuccinia psidii MF-1]|uniref:Uncharacterized protein n=1 Tax=Austropuccinia psidii MF-1 TaxID=1389203 RepID=A0A9Q3KVU5_9BASI|nr:hypothetical protein [Austropuccinia psidii MF-1]
MKENEIFNNESYCKQIPISHQLAIALERLGSNGNAGSVGRFAQNFKLIRCAIISVTRWVIKYINSLKKDSLKWHDYQRRNAISQVMKEEGFDGCVSQPQVMTLLHGCCGNPAWNQVGANWPHHIVYGQLAPFCVLWTFGHSTFPLASGHILPSLAFLANFHIPNPQASIFVLVLGVSFCLLGGSGPPSHNHILGHPFSLGGLGPKWPFWAI